MASFNGVDLGFVFSMNVAANPIGMQTNVYPGSNGLEVLTQGSRGGATVMEGGITAPTAVALAAAEQSLRALQVSGTAATLVDQTGSAWANVIFLVFRPKGRIMPLADGGYGRMFDAEFFHVA